MTCPDCGAIELVPDVATAEDRLHDHLVRFGGDIVLLEALAAAGATVHGFSHGQTQPGFEAFEGIFQPHELSLSIGAGFTWVLVTPPRSEPWSWRIRVPVQIRGTGERALPHVLRAIHDTEVAPGLRAEGFTPEPWPAPEAAPNAYLAIWSRSVGNPAAAAAFVHAVARLQTEVSADDFLWERSFGDLGAMTAFASRLPPGVHVTQLTPWGISLAAADRRDLGCIGGDGRGRIYVYLVLPHGFGARAARRREAVALEWFETNGAESWRAHGFTEARFDGPAPFDAGRRRRWAVRLVLQFSPGEDAEGRLAWAAEHGVLELE
ncbi:hypothetical protein LBMAG42_45190 [Deltaproteobacteria bacterium]|nr:hypothetical protein LBMAG42_45190 [Deltaproteobacteria bacterium]